MIDNSQTKERSCLEFFLDSTGLALGLLIFYSVMFGVVLGVVSVGALRAPDLIILTLIALGVFVESRALYYKTQSSQTNSEKPSK